MGSQTGFSIIMYAVALPFVLVNIAYYGGVIEGAKAVHASPGEPTPAQLAERDDSDALPGRFVENQGRLHTGTYPLAHRVDFCAPSRIEDTCYASNPPTSGLHIPVQRNAQLESGDRVTLPPNPGIYDFVVPRESIPHIQEHGGVYLGYNCASAACDDAVELAKDVVAEELSLGGRVVMSPDPDLDGDTIALASWTRIDSFAASDYDDARVRAFIKAHSCRFDPEGLCPNRALN